MSVTLVLGGARSGKSARALALADGAAEKVFVATAEPLDAEMAARIARHRAERGADWTLVEVPLELPGAIGESAGVGRTLVVDCLTLWLSNLLHAERDTGAATRELVAALGHAQGDVVLVSNEIGLGLAPMNALGRAFRDAQGTLNQRVAAAANRVEFVAAGLPLRLKGEP